MTTLIYHVYYTARHDLPDGPITRLSGFRHQYAANQTARNTRECVDNPDCHRARSWVVPLPSGVHPPERFASESAFSAYFGVTEPALTEPSTPTVDDLGIA